MERLIRLYEELGQSPWLDNLKRGYLTSGQLAELRDGGIRGLTSNPTIFQKAIADSTDYDDQFRSLSGDDGPLVDDYWALVIADIDGACDVLDSVYESSEGRDGFVSVEVAPDLADDSAGTESAARLLHERIARRNLMVKIPATGAGVAPIRQMISEGRNVNITLIFSLDRHQEVMDAYLDGLEAHAATDGADLASVASVASFFVSRVDTEVDRRLEAIGTDGALDLRGTAAVAQAKLAYRQFQRTFSGPRWEALAARGARVQRPLWASTSTKNPEYPDTLYVDELIGPDTVNTMPDATIEAFADHGTLERRVDAGLAAAESTWQRLEEVGVDMADVAEQLEREGVASFEKSFDELLQTLSTKAAELGSSPGGDGVRGRSPRERVGEQSEPSEAPAVETRARELAEELAPSSDRRSAVELLAAALGLLSDRPDPLDLKIAAAAMTEMREAFAVFAPYRDVQKVTVFGSARTAANDPLYEQARRIAATLAGRGWMVVTGAGPGIMQAAMEGAGREQSIGVAIRLPFEQGANPVIAGDDKYVSMRYFFTRKLMLVKESRAFVCLPGGFGTLDETFELLTLTQTGKGLPVPIVLLDTPGDPYWERVDELINEQLVERGLVSPADRRLYLVTSSCEEAAAEIDRFYANYHSIRYVGEHLVVRLRHAPADAQLAELNERFAALVARGRIERTAPFDIERRHGDHVELPRIRMVWRKHRSGDLRTLIDAVNDMVPMPPPQQPPPDDLPPPLSDDAVVDQASGSAS